MGDNTKNLPEIVIEETKMVNGIKQNSVFIKVTGQTEEACFEQYKKVKKENGK